ncbi:hypothetical protein [Arthrobacter sp. ISL-5]|uniref:hypothetical protein n=1 Tax=Arthrobacter sp. ISL-5 TaxID=2819111 RepID=UPI001BE649E4|nr:hypothetical protein [Arthrobacter sp. ISL-5]MBT2552794.1 hypothetical protein [Arthrobacter sp. ISL-5]
MLIRRPRASHLSKVSGPWAERHAKELFTYEMVLQRELEQDAMLWQTPTIALTAQAFLLTIALNPSSPAFATYLAAALGLVVALLSMQLMAKHRFLNLMDRAHLHALEARLRMEHLSNRQYFYTDGAYQIPNWLVGHKSPPSEHGLARFRSYRVWIGGMVIFAAVNLGIIAVQIWAPGLLDAPPAPTPLP